MRPYSPHTHTHTHIKRWWPVAVTELNQGGKLKTYRLASVAVRGNICVCICQCVMCVRVCLWICVWVVQPAFSTTMGFHYYLMLSHLLCHLTNRTPTHTHVYTTHRYPAHTHVQTHPGHRYFSVCRVD